MKLVIGLFIFLLLLAPAAAVSEDQVFMLKFNWGTEDPVYSKTIQYGNFSCVVDDKNTACSMSENAISVILTPSLRGTYNHQESQIKIYDENNNLRRVFVELITFDAMGWVGIPTISIPGAPGFLFEKEPISHDVVGVRLWWVVLLLFLFVKWVD